MKTLLDRLLIWRQQNKTTQQAIKLVVIFEPDTMTDVEFYALYTLLHLILQGEFETRTALLGRLYTRSLKDVLP